MIKPEVIKIIANKFSNNPEVVADAIYDMCSEIEHELGGDFTPKGYLKIFNEFFKDSKKAIETKGDEK